MIQRVYEQAKACDLLNRVIVATDDDRISQCVKEFEGEIEMTSPEHTNGTERCAEVAARNEADYYINIQGDEPFIKPEQIGTLAKILDGNVELGTLVKKIVDPSLLDNPNTMKVLLSKEKNALYFSRACVPFLRDYPKTEWLNHHTFFKHIGIYAYRRDILESIVQLPQSHLEKAESLEQLRWLENGYQIKVAETELETIGIDAPDDVERALKLEGLL